MAECILKTVGLFNRMTRLFKSGSALVYDYYPEYGGILVEYTWGRFDYGTGFLQADAAMSVAWMLNLCHQGHGRHMY